MEDSPETQRSTLRTQVLPKVWPSSQTTRTTKTLAVSQQDPAGAAGPGWRNEYELRSLFASPGEHVVVSLTAFLVTSEQHPAELLKSTNHSARFSFANTAGSKAIPHLPWRPSWGAGCWCPGGFCKRAPRCCQSGPGYLWGWCQREDCSTGQYKQHLKMNRNYWISSYFTLSLAVAHSAQTPGATVLCIIFPGKLHSWRTDLAASTWRRSHILTTKEFKHFYF